jgi:hypothetical protein
LIKSWPRPHQGLKTDAEKWIKSEDFEEYFIRDLGDHRYTRRMNAMANEVHIEIWFLNGITKLAYPLSNREHKIRAAIGRTYFIPSSIFNYSINYQLDRSELAKPQ